MLLTVSAPSRMSATRTAAPSRAMARAMAWPIPRALPVTTAALPSSFMATSGTVSCVLLRRHDGEVQVEVDALAHPYAPSDEVVEGQGEGAERHPGRTLRVAEQTRLGQVVVKAPDSRDHGPDTDDAHEGHPQPLHSRG